MADNKVHKEIDNVQIELYTDKKDITAEATLATVLNQNEIPYQTIDSEHSFTKSIGCTTSKQGI